MTASVAGEQDVPEAAPGGEAGLADVVTLQRRRAAEVSEGDEQRFFLDTIAEYQWARDAAGLTPGSLDNLIRPVLELCDFYGVAAWRLTSRHVDKYFAGEGKRARSTMRAKLTAGRGGVERAHPGDRGDAVDVS